MTDTIRTKIPTDFPKRKMSDGRSYSHRQRNMFYASTMWVKTSSIVRAQEPACRLCHSGDGLTVDHLDGDITNNNRDNLIPLCPQCHSWKTNQFEKQHKLSTVRTELDFIKWALPFVAVCNELQAYEEICEAQYVQDNWANWLSSKLHVMYVHGTFRKGLETVADYIAVLIDSYPTIPHEGKGNGTPRKFRDAYNSTTLLRYVLLRYTHAQRKL